MLRPPLLGSIPSLLLLSSFLLSPTSAQVLTSSNSPLPACASSCPLLQQAATACGGLTTSSQAIWVCFCQSAYLTTLYNSGEGVCADVCGTTAERDTLRVWYTGECGSDKGYSEHPDTGGQAGQGQGSTTTAAGGAATTTSAGAGAVATASTGGTSGGSVTSGISEGGGEGGGWWSGHWKWILMLILLFILLLLIALAAVWWKRRHDRKADILTSSFNPGITSRAVPGTGAGAAGGGGYAGERGPEMHERGPHRGVMDEGAGQGNNSALAFDGPSGSAVGVGAAGGVLAASGSGNGRQSPARTREAFMPYGYGYARSESRLASQSGGDNGDTIESVGGSGRVRERAEGIGGEDMGGSGRKEKGKKRVLVRERDAR